MPTFENGTPFDGLKFEPTTFITGEVTPLTETMGELPSHKELAAGFAGQLTHSEVVLPINPLNSRVIAGLDEGFTTKVEDAYQGWRAKRNAQLAGTAAEQSTDAPEPQA